MLKKQYLNKKKALLILSGILLSTKEIKAITKFRRRFI